MKNKKNDFPILNQTINGNPLTYLDSAATTQKPSVVLDAISSYYKTYNANVRRALYPIAEKATIEVENVRQQVALFLNAETKDEIVFVRNTTEALNLLAHSLSSKIGQKDIVATTILEHHSNFVPWQMLAARTGAWFEVIDFDEKFDLVFPDFSKISILALTHVSNVLGTIHNLKKIIKIARGQNPNIIIVVDAAQSIAHMKVDVKDLDCDFLAFSGHKMYAGMGVGVLYGKKKMLESLDPFLYGGEMIDEVSVEKTTFQKVPYKFEAGTPVVSDIISLGAALTYLNRLGIENIHEYESTLVTYALTRLSMIDGLSLVGQENKSKRSPVIAFTMDGIHPHDIAQILGDQGICIRAGHHCCMPLHKRLNISASARISLSFYNKEQDIDYLIDGLKSVQKVFSV